MEDLRKECAERMRETVHGEEINTDEYNVSLAKMLGVTPFGAVHTHKAEHETILDHNHSFWQEYEEDVRTRNAVEEHVKKAIQSLIDDDVVYKESGEDSVYFEVYIEPSPDSLPLQTECGDCGRSVDAETELLMQSGDNNRTRYTLRVEVECDCGYSTIRESNMRKVA